MGGTPSRVLESPAILLGGADVLKDESFFTSNAISSVVSVGDEAPPAEWTHITRRLHVRKQDTPDADLAEHFDKIIAFVHSARCAGRVVFIVRRVGAGDEEEEEAG